MGLIVLLNPSAEILVLLTVLYRYVQSLSSPSSAKAGALPNNARAV